MSACTRHDGNKRLDAVFQQQVSQTGKLLDLFAATVKLLQQSATSAADNGSRSHEAKIDIEEASGVTRASNCICQANYAMKGIAMLSACTKDAHPTAHAAGVQPDVPPIA
jgi:hypothetical protein